MKSLQGAHRVHKLTRYGSLRAVRDIGALLVKTIGVGIRWRRDYVGSRYNLLPCVRVLQRFPNSGATSVVNFSGSPFGGFGKGEAR